MIPLFKVHMPEDAIVAAAETLRSGYIGQGAVCDVFEKKLARFVGRPAVTTMTCTAALQMALRLAGVGPGTSVISTPMTCTATNEPILALGANILWADIDPTTGNIDPASVKRLLEEHSGIVQAVMAVDWGGYPCELRELQSLADEFSVHLIEDAAHAFGAIYQGAYVGSVVDITCFSFQAIKTITTIEGGAMTFAPDLEKQFATAKLMRWYGIDREGKRKDLRVEEDIVDFGYKANMNDVHAQLGIVQLQHVDRLLMKARTNAIFYEERLRDLPHVKLLSYRPDRLSSYWLFTILVDNRGHFQEHMAGCGVMCSQVHVRNDVHTVFKPFARSLPGVDEFSASQVSIPVGWWVTEVEREHIAQSIENWSSRN